MGGSCAKLVDCYRLNCVNESRLDVAIKQRRFQGRSTSYSPSVDSTKGSNYLLSTFIRKVIESDKKRQYGKKIAASKSETAKKRNSFAEKSRRRSSVPQRRKSRQHSKIDGKFDIEKTLEGVVGNFTALSIIDFIKIFFTRKFAKKVAKIRIFSTFKDLSNRMKELENHDF